MGEDVVLGESHGCVHVKPSDLDDMVNRRFLKNGSVVVVHRYAESRISYAKPRARPVAVAALGGGFVALPAVAAIAVVGVVNEASVLVRPSSLMMSRAR